MTTTPTIVGASAGSGKTYRLTLEVTRALTHDAAAPVHIDGLVAVTFTRKAQAELTSRIRRALVEAGAFDQAARLPVAYLGTVHAVCMRLLEEFALDAGMSPYPDVMPDDGGRRLRAAIEDGLPPTMIEDLGDLAARLEIYPDARIGRHDWMRRVIEIMELARSNRIAPDRLPAMGARSATGLLAHLPAAADGDAVEAGFGVELDRAIAALATSDDRTQKTASALRTLREIRGRRASGEVRWSDWPRAARVEPSVRCRAAVAPLVAAAAHYDRHPALHEDLRRFTTGVFEAARLALGGYATWKAQRRLVDYTDMIDHALRLVEVPGVAAELAARLQLVVVDEFQDTSPLQLALFTRLHRLAGRSVWVGDGKQCIFEYAGADPALMDAMVDWVARAGGAAEQLDRNYRSRPELVDACAELFVRAFAPHGWSPASVRTTAARASPDTLAVTPPFAVWWLDSKNVEQDAEAIALATARMLVDTPTPPVVDRVTGEVRAAGPRDVGILTATNAEAQRIAAALARRGVRANLPRDGLMKTPEGVLMDAALRWVLEPGDRLALATLEALHGWNGADPDAWLAARLSGAELPVPAWREPLAGLRSQLDVLSPAEALDRAIDLVGAASLCARWPAPSQRLGNLDALQALAMRYEDRCARHREPATIPGLVRYFAEAQTTVRVGEEERATDDQCAGVDEDAVTVCTYHRAKGLEWPVVVLTSLDRHERRDAFDPCPESDRPGFDPDGPLAGRWIRFWPWPFGQQARLPLADAAAASMEGRRVAEREQRERVRLLYVGFTRARDHLVLAARATPRGPKTTWLDELVDLSGAPLLALPIAAGDRADAFLGVGDLLVRCRVTRPTGITDVDPLTPPRRRLARSRLTEPPLARYRITPSQREEVPPGQRYVIDRVQAIGPGLRLRGRCDWARLGSAAHAFLAADRCLSGACDRLATAEQIVARAGLGSVLDADALLQISDRLREVLDERWPGATWQHEVPVTAIIITASGPRRIDGVIDLLGLVPDGVVVIDHKTYPAPSLHAVATHAAALTPQLASYAAALERRGHRVVGAHLHFPIAGAWVDLRAVFHPVGP